MLDHLFEGRTEKEIEALGDVRYVLHSPNCLGRKRKQTRLTFALGRASTTHYEFANPNLLDLQT